MDSKKITEFLIKGKTPTTEDGINNYSYDWEEINDIAQGLVNLFSLHIVSSSANFKENARPLLKYLAENHHPHTTAIITSTSIELVEGIKAEYKI